MAVFCTSKIMKNIRNIAIIAHVDHGKTTLVDALLRQSNTQMKKEFDQKNLIMDTNELEKERGITIFSKNASVVYKGTKINIIDTPGHADFGGEVERVLSMVDGCLLLVDAQDGPMPQTRFVLKQALKMKHKIIVVINKVDKTNARVSFALNRIFDLFVELGADEDTAFFPVIYAVAKEGKASLTPELSSMHNIAPIFNSIIEHIPEPAGDSNKPLQLLVSNITYDNHKGRIAIGKVYNGTLNVGEQVARISRAGEITKTTISTLGTFEGLEKIDVKTAEAGDIVAVSGNAEITIGETLTDAQNPVALSVLKIEEPTIRMTFSVNTSPFAGREGKLTTSRHISERLYKELETDVALRVEDGPKGDWIVSGRGELHLAILIERLRREGYEFQVARPQVITKLIDGKRLTPYEQVFIEVPEEYSGTVMQKMGARHGQLVDMKTEEKVAFFEFIISTRELFGYRSEFIADTKGLGILNTLFYEYKAETSSRYTRGHGSLVAHESGTTKTYGLINAQDRGIIFVSAGEMVYKGQVIGKNPREEDIKINVCREKNLTNMRSKGEDVAARLKTPVKMGLEEALEYIDDTELVEVTPKNIRIRKIILDEVEQRRSRMLNRN
ncbi:GTP-binding protein TypA [Candidatus Curtissbacteria bacterium RIFCSPLOWO2_01_FULL_41_28]|nr:MAG: GTP-binding protein TypA [Microgenomates group bacterium GW2011_GWC1_40_35]KKR74991.1 MAG: GTP-binding protein TypA [Candidatus Curtissbacteria bacterium GW2011_GWD1_40_8]KKS01626.1 MAG: GTP-binding protein TypA [Candidatus Curtissbacteria bacterium GW2011_GWC2_41_21]OGD78379.1 MAG: GTP-binding protein TypA [Candidatus Curtissbacteria bacterium RIFCSPHIGHO2_01_FULL_34_40]OGD95144.1 MAG: GTP-binding protein TypA [Candidatus Curtissbacteria bacterium RIFCSPLOWO2_01_FULL_41_28]OGE09569.1 